MSKKDGSTLITTVIIFMFVLIVSGAMLSAIRGNYKMRVVESKRTENLYASESGLEVVSNIINKDLSSAANYGKEKVIELEKMKELSPEEFKKFYTQHDGDDKYAYQIMYRMLLDDIDYQDWNVNQMKDPKDADKNNAKDSQQKDREYIEKVKNMVFKQGVKEFLDINGGGELNNENNGEGNINNSRPKYFNNLINSIENLYYISYSDSRSIEEKKYITLDKMPVIFVGDKDKKTASLVEQKKENNLRNGIEYWNKNQSYLPDKNQELHYFVGEYAPADKNGVRKMEWSKKKCKSFNL